MTNEELKNKIVDEFAKGNVAFAGHSGIQLANLKEFIQQPADGLLYDLNRDEMTVLTFLEDPKWVNDFAVCKVIRELHGEIARLTAQNQENAKRKISI